MENMVINRGNPRKVSVTVLGSNGVKIELSKCTDVELILWINGRSKRASNTQILSDILVAELTESELDYLGEYSAQIKYTDNGVVNTSERVYLFRVANEFYRTASGTGLSDGGTLEISVSTPQAINKGYSAYEIAVQNGYVGTEKEWLASLSQESKDAAAVAYDAAQSALNKAQLANDAAINANSAAASVNSAKDSAIQAATSANSAASSANAAKDSANSAATNANEKADLANTAALNADVAKVNAEKATADANTATLNATNAANNANAKAVYANEQGDYAKQQGLNAVATANEAATNANNSAFNASQQAAYAKQQGDYAKAEAEGIDAKIATKANQSDLVQLEQDVNIARGDVQGCSFVSNTSVEYQSIELWIDSSNIGYTEYSDILGGGMSLFLMGGTSFIGIRYKSVVYTFANSERRKKMSLLLSKVDGGVTLHMNGVFCSKINVDISEQNLSSFCNYKKAITYLIRTFNSALTQQQIDTIYNQGRCDEVVLNSELRSLCKNEYLPQYLTATKWIDNGVNKQDIALTAPIFTYVQPYKQYSFGNGAPTTPPDAAFTEYTDVDTGRVWKSGGKPSTRQFDLNDYGIIKQGRS